MGWCQKVNCGYWGVREKVKITKTKKGKDRIGFINVGAFDVYFLKVF